VGDSFDQASGSVYQVELASTGAGDRIVVGGPATLASGAVVNVARIDSGRYAIGTRYTILTAVGAEGDGGVGPGRTGTYTLTGATRVSSFINIVGTYDANNAYLNVLQTRAFAAAGATPNQVAAAGGADFPANGALFTALAYSQTDAIAQNAFDQISGELHASLRGVAFEDSRFVREAVVSHLRASGNDLRTGMWFQGFGSWGKIDGDGNAANVKRDIGGFFIGTDVVNTEALTAGFVGGYATADVKIPDRGSRATTDDWSIGAYFDYTASGFGLRAGIDHKWRNIRANRFVTFPGFSDGVTSRYQSRLLQIYGDVGYGFKFGGVELEPFGQLAWVQVKSDDFREQGATAALRANGRSDDYWVSLLGGRFGFTDGKIGVTATGGWRRTWGGDLNTPLAMQFAAGPSFEVAGPGIARDVVALGLRVNAKIGPDVDISIGYSGQTGGGLTDNGVKGALTFNF
jgi:outer membrane autotransporter protein